MVDPAAAAKLAARLEPCHSFIYFAPEAGLNFHALGLKGGAGYFVSRSAAMGAVPAEVVIATFYNFKPDLVRESMADAWTITTPEAVLEARFDAAGKAIRSMLGDQAESPDLVAVTELVRGAMADVSPAGRALYAGHASLPWPTDPVQAFWHAITLIREYRGDAHVSALMLEGLDPVEALVTHAASGLLRLPKNLLQATRAWTDEEWAAAEERLRERGLLDDEGGFTADGTAQRRRVEELTTRSSLAPYEAMGDDGMARLAELVEPFSKTIRTVMFTR